MGIEQDTKWMHMALEQAKLAQAHNEVPVGAVLVHNDKVIATGHNSPITHHDPSAHAEMIALRKAGQAFENYRLLDTTLYVTLEPCIMCAGLLVHARIKRLVFGAYDRKAGAVKSIAQILDHPKLNHRVEVEAGVLEKECSEILKNFFSQLRQKDSSK
jgi:tRNA(adenine34) deaminase